MAFPLAEVLDVRTGTSRYRQVGPGTPAPPPPSSASPPADCWYLMSEIGRTGGGAWCRTAPAEASRLTPSCRTAVQVGELGMGRPHGMDQVGTREVEQVATVC